MALLGTLILDVSAERAAASFVESALISVLAPVRAVFASDSWSCSSSALPSLSSSCCRRRWDSFASSVWAASWALRAVMSSLAARSRREIGQLRSRRVAMDADAAHSWPFPPIVSLVCHNCVLLPTRRPLVALGIWLLIPGTCASNRPPVFLPMDHWERGPRLTLRRRGDSHRKGMAAVRDCAREAPEAAHLHLRCRSLPQSRHAVSRGSLVLEAGSRAPRVLRVVYRLWPWVFDLF